MKQGETSEDIAKNGGIKLGEADEGNESRGETEREEEKEEDAEWVKRRKGRIRGRNGRRGKGGC